MAVDDEVCYIHDLQRPWNVVCVLPHLDGLTHEVQLSVTSQMNVDIRTRIATSCLTFFFI
jgi:hypothetical protein